MAGPAAAMAEAVRRAAAAPPTAAHVLPGAPAYRLARFAQAGSGARRRPVVAGGMDTAVAAALTVPDAGAASAPADRCNRPPGRSREGGGAVAAGRRPEGLPAACPPTP